jgi:hypothetical protein
MQEEKLLYSRSLYLQHPFAAYKKALTGKKLAINEKS